MPSTLSLELKPIFFSLWYLKKMPIAIRGSKAPAPKKNVTFGANKQREFYKGDVPLIKPPTKADVSYDPFGGGKVAPRPKPVSAPVRPKAYLVPFKPSATGALPTPSIPLSARATAPVSVNPIAITSGTNSVKPLLSRTRTKVAAAAIGGIGIGYGLGAGGVSGVPDALQFGMSIFA